MRLGIDTGGTFTDVVRDDGTTAKVASTPQMPAAAVRRAVETISDGRDVTVLAHGTTVATNALLEGRGTTVALVANEGFADVIEIARQVRPSLYDAFADRPAPLVPRHLRYGVRGRLDGCGREIERFDGVVPDLPEAVDAVAVCLLHADLDARHERAVAAALHARGARNVVCSHAVSPEFREYERMVTAAAEAFLRPLCAPYLTKLGALARDVLVMTSAGGLIPLADAAAATASLLLSGPAAGVRAAAAYASACGFRDAVTFDMGGTSTDVCLVREGVPDRAAQRVVAGYPIRLPALAVHTIGAGGGSIAAIDNGGALTVGPRSAGAQPGPACYARGGSAATVTDADLLLGRIDPAATFPDLERLDVVAARAAVDRAGTTAESIVRVVDDAMEHAVRAVTVARGVDPRQLVLVAFGGAGPLHACAIADALGMRGVLVPPRAGVGAAVGLLGAPRARDVVHTFAGDDLDAALAAVAREARDRVGDDASVTTAVDCRYAGQSHELTVPSVAAFPAEHERRNGHVRPGAPIEVVAVRAHAERPAPLAVTDLPGIERRLVRGPAAVAEPDCTVWIPDGWRATPRELGVWFVERA